MSSTFFKLFATVSNALSEVDGEELLFTNVSSQTVLQLSSFVGFNCKFNRNGLNGIYVDSLTNFYLNGKSCELAHNSLKGMQGNTVNEIYGGCIKVGRDVPLDMSKLNGTPDCETHQLYVRPFSTN